MAQVSPTLRRTETGFQHWCAGCRDVHPLPSGWTFDGNIHAPTFSPSFLHRGLKRVTTENDGWTGEWERDEAGQPRRYVCHYILTAGILNYCGDCTHDLVGRSVPLPELPPFMRDGQADD